MKKRISNDAVNVNLPVFWGAQLFLMKKAVKAFACLILVLYGSGVFAQSQQVSGTVKGETGPLPGITVAVKGTQTAVQTNTSGNFTIQAAAKDTLVFTSAGYVSQEVEVNNRTQLAITMVTDPQSLEGVVVIGYGTKKRQFMTSAVSSVNSDVIESRPVPNTMSALQGQVPGLTIQRTAGKPGAEGYDLNVRGASSTNGGNSPLVLIDGVNGNLDLLNPDDIESVNVLKDAAASIYGARAAGGVVLVTTKKGRRDKPTVSYTNNFAVTKLTGMMNSPTHYEMAIMDNEANIHNGAAPLYTPELLEKLRNNDPNPIPHPNGFGGWLLFFSSTDWLDAVMENGFQQKHNLSLSGGGNNSTYYLSGSYVDQRGVIKYADDNNERYNLRMNYDYDISKRIRLESKLSVESQKRTDLGGLGSWLITEAVFGMPNHPVYNKNGQLFAQGGWGNAVGQAQNAETATFKTRGVNTNFKLIADVVKGLKLNLQTGLSYLTENNKDIAKAYPLYTNDGDTVYYDIVRAGPQASNMTLYDAETWYRNYTGYLQYNKRFANKHDLDIMAGVSHEESDWDWNSSWRDGFLTDDIWSINLGGTSNMNINGGGTQWALRSLFSRLGYVYNNKYMLEANLRYDGSSRFHPDTRWGLFPGISLGWRLSEENFMKELGWFNDLKFRISYGETGNQEGIRLYDYIQLMRLNGSTYPFGPGRLEQSFQLDTLASTERTWETIVNKNVGVDVSMLSSRLNFTFDYFVKTNKDMLIPVTYPSVLGSIPPFSNSGELKTWGFETSVAWRDQIGKVDYSARLILSDAKNELIDYGGADTYVTGLNYIREGYPLNTYFAYVFDGLIRTQKELDDYKKLGGIPSDISIGDARFKDLNGDGVISPTGNQPGDDGDVTAVGNISPRYSFGINLGAQFKGFDLSLFMQGVGKRTMFREGEYSIPWTDWWRQPPQFYYGKTWNEDRPDAEYPRLSHGNIRWWNYQPSTMQKIDASYIRLKNLQVGYSLPKQLISKIYLSQARIYFSGENLWEAHSVKGGWDPETDRWGFNYPFQRLYSFGIDITF